MPEWPKYRVLYLHAAEDYPKRIGMSLGLTGDALDKFSFALDTIEFNLEIHEDGTYNILSVRDMEFTDRAFVACRVVSLELNEEKE